MDITTVMILFAVVFTLFYLNKLRNSKDMIPPQKFKELLEEQSGVIIDVRTPSEYEDGHLKKADLNIDISADFEQKVERLNQDNNYYLYCHSGARSERATQLMKRKGFENVYNVGGLESLVEAGFEKE